MCFILYRILGFFFGGGIPQECSEATPDFVLIAQKTIGPPACKTLAVELSTCLAPEFNTIDITKFVQVF